MPHIKSDNASIYYKIDGEGEPIIFVSGFSADHSSWAELIPTFHEQGHASNQYFQTIAIDNRGVGQSTWNNQSFSISDMAHDVVHVCRALSLPNVHLVGSSLGGFIIQEVARLYPELIKSLIIVNSSTKININFLIYVQGEIELRTLYQDNIPPEILLKLGMGWAFGHHFLSQPGMVQQFERLTREKPAEFPIEIEKNQLEIVKHFDSTDWVSTIKQPCLVTGSDSDLIFLDRHTRGLADLLSNSKYVYFENVGHLPQIEAPSELATEMLKFYDEIR